MRMSFEVPAEAGGENAKEKEGQKTRIIVMLGARLAAGSMDGGHSPIFPLVNESTKEGMPKEVAGGDSRMRAIQELYEEYVNENGEAAAKNFRVFTTGGTEELTDPETGEVTKLSRAGEADRKLSEKYGLPDEIVETLPSGGSTLGNAKVLAEWVKEHQEEVGDIEEIEIVTNEFHIARAWLMFQMALYKNEKEKDVVFTPEDIEKIESLLDTTLSDTENGDKAELAELQEIMGKYFTGLSLRITPDIVEDILERRGAGGQKYAELIRNNPDVERSRGLERNGIKDLIHGRYQVK